jgi:hypothetical protein
MTQEKQTKDRKATHNISVNKVLLRFNPMLNHPSVTASRVDLILWVLNNFGVDLAESEAPIRRTNSISSAICFGQQKHQ